MICWRQNSYHYKQRRTKQNKNHNKTREIQIGKTISYYILLKTCIQLNRQEAHRFKIFKLATQGLCFEQKKKEKKEKPFSVNCLQILGKKTGGHVLQFYIFK